MAGYALIKDGFVKNIVAWDGEGDPDTIFSGYQVIETSDTFYPAIGDAYVNGKLIRYPADGYEYVFNTESLQWQITAESDKQRAKDVVAQAIARKNNLLTEAQNTISLWQTELLLDMISEEDKEKLTQWVIYIKALKQVDTAKAPDIKWPDTPEY